MDAPLTVLPDTYCVWVPIEDTEMLKSVEVDANGDWIVSGVMSSDDLDEEADSITPDGMDCSYFLTKGWIKYEHGNNPNQFIGEPLEVRVGQFDHPTLRKSVNGIYVKGRLFQNRELAKQAVSAIEDLQKSHSKRRMGWSIEGNVKERDRTTGKILKSILRNVVLTMNPVNTMTWAELAKSFAKNHEVEVDMEKALDTGGMAEVMPQSVEGTTHKDPQDEWIRMFRKFVRSHALKKSLRKSFLKCTPGEAGFHAYLFARREGTEYDEACEFGAYVSGRSSMLKSLFGKIGGEKMPKQTQAKLAEALDTDLEELRKSLETDDTEIEEDGEELAKSQKADDDDDDDDEKDGGGEDDEKDDGGGEDDEKDDGGGEDDGKPIKKAVKTEFAKSLSENEGGEALDVSGFLTAIADEIGFNFDGFSKSLTHVAKQQVATVTVLGKLGDLVKSLSDKLDEVSGENVELRKSLDEMLQRPVGRKSVVNQREVQTITKSLGKEDGEKPMLTRGQVMNVLQKSFDGGNMAMGKELMRYEGGVQLEDLRLTPEVKSELGLK